MQKLNIFEVLILVKNNTYTILIVVLSVLLTISLVAGVTFAWFYSDVSVSYRLTLGDPVTIKVVDRENIPTGGVLDVSTSETIGARSLMPGKPIHMNAKARLDQSNTEAIVRARIEVEVNKSGSQLTEQDIINLNKSLNDSVEALINNNNNWVFAENNVDEVVDGVETGHLVSDGGWWYYTFSNENKENKEESELFRIKSDETTTEEDRVIDFIVGVFNFPTSADNKYANAEIKFTVVFQALQGKIANTTGSEFNEEDMENIAGEYAGYIKNKIKNVQPIFHYAFGDGRIF